MQETQRHGFDPWVGRSLGGGHGNPLQHCCLENPMDRGDRQAIVHRVTQSDTTEVTQHEHTHKVQAFQNSDRDHNLLAGYKITQSTLLLAIKNTLKHKRNKSSECTICNKSKYRFSKPVTSVIVCVFEDVNVYIVL